MTAIVWTALITAVATVTGSLGGVWITTRHDDKAQARQAMQNRGAAREDQQRQAYGELVKTARLALRNFRQLGLAYAANTPGIPAVNEALSQAAGLAADMNQAAALAELVGSPGARKQARAIYDKAKACADLFQTRELILAALPNTTLGRLLSPVASAVPGGIRNLVPFDAEKADALCSELATAIDQFIEAANAELNSDTTQPAPAKPGARRSILRRGAA
jgi:hypothetical protein